MFRPISLHGDSTTVICDNIYQNYQWGFWGMFAWIAFFFQFFFPREIAENAFLVEKQLEIFRYSSCLAYMGEMLEMGVQSVKEEKSSVDTKKVILSRF